MRTIDADGMREDWIDAMNEPAYCANDVLDSIDEQPTVDAVEVVRCKDCKKENTDDCTMCGFYLFLTTLNNDYCSYGKPKGGVE